VVIRLLLVAFVAACSSPRPSSLDRQLAINAEQHGVVGQAVLVLRDEEVVFRGSHGVVDRETGQPMRPDQLFPVFSVSKLFTSILVYELVERGEVDLKAPIGRHVADLPERWRRVTVEQLLSHASGLPDYFAPGMTGGFPTTAREMFASLADKPLLFEPGSELRYTQTNFVLLGALLEAHYGQPYRQVATERIVTRLGLASTYFWRPSVPAGKLVTSYRGKDGRVELDSQIAWPEYAITHAELFSTVDDLATFITAVRTGRFVKPETLLALWKPYRLPGGDAGWSANGWEYETSGAERFVGHDGGEVVRVRLVFTDSLARGTHTYIYLTNGSAKNVWSRTLVDSLRR
jgi:CubicO group peptidase (beta-lactamase class C family)